jgi:hypothetical protein
MITSIAVEVVEPDRLDHPLLAGSSGLRICREGTKLDDGRHQEPRQVSAITTLHFLWELVIFILIMCLLYIVIKWSSITIAFIDIEFAWKPSLIAIDYDRKFP